MPATHYEIFKVRNYECDASGHLRGATYLRWMQESAFAASAAVGYDFSRYHNIGQIWLIHETAVEYLAPLHYGDEVEVKTWVMDIRRFRSRRAYEIRHRATGEVAARASTDWVYLDAETLRPQMIPEAIQLAFFPEGVPPETSPRERHPVAHDRPPKAISLSRTVAWSDIDMMWHVNNARYLEYVEDAETRACALRGWPMERMLEEGLRIHTRQHRLEYRRPAILGDVLNIATWCTGIDDTTALRHTEIRRAEDGELLVRAQARWGLSNRETGAALRIPSELLHPDRIGPCVGHGPVL